MPVMVTESDFERGATAVESARAEVARCQREYGPDSARVAAAGLILDSRVRNQVDLRRHIAAQTRGGR